MIGQDNEKSIAKFKKNGIEQVEGNKLQAEHLFTASVQLYNIGLQGKSTYI